MNDPTCSVDDCSGRIVARGLCGKHYQREKYMGSVDGYQPKTCPQCGTEFRPYRSDQVYCTPACKVAAATHRRPKVAAKEYTCSICGVRFTSISRRAPVICGSDACRRTYHTEAAIKSRAKARAERPNGTCAECGNSFEITQGPVKYCSKACKRAAHLRRRRETEYVPEPRTCVECGGPVPYKSGKTKFCSVECHRTAVARLSRWKVKGLMPDHGMPELCGLCGATATERRLDVDHDHQCCPGQRSCGKCVRGFLCRPCNVGIGMFGDDPARLIAAAEYIERHRAARTH